MSQTEQELIYEASLGRLQIDNHGQIDPLYPVILKPKCTAKKNEVHDHFTMTNVSPVMEQYISLKNNIPNMRYINWLEFLVQELEIKIELSHLMSMIEWYMAFNEKQGVGLASTHEIFKDRTLMTGIIIDPDVGEPGRPTSKRADHFSASVVEESKDVGALENFIGENSEEEEE